VYLFMTLEAFVVSVALALQASGLIQSHEYGLLFGTQISASLELECPPEQEVTIDCRDLWRELFELQEYNEIGSDWGSYADAARTMVGEVMSASLAADRG
jgi:hypothetical protein